MQVRPLIGCGKHQQVTFSLFLWCSWSTYRRRQWLTRKKYVLYTKVHFVQSIRCFRSFLMNCNLSCVLSSEESKPLQLSLSRKLDKTWWMCASPPKKERERERERERESIPSSLKGEWVCELFQKDFPFWKSYYPDGAASRFPWSRKVLSAVVVQV